MADIAGVITVNSTKDVPTLVKSLTSAVQEKKLTVFATVDHALGAKEAGLNLRPTTLVIFGNAQGGTPLMSDVQLTGLVLPLRVLVWEDEAGGRHLSYEDIDHLATRFGLGEASAAARGKIKGLLAGLSSAVA